ncbi:MAG: CheR family methyltransferase [Candidatus Vecturithrix sp.]|jgi:chemotaxis protein methyltransferase CheR|nr:CheR family methyltransferase [Candidatus Vecturithrix sp.]
MEENYNQRIPATTMSDEIFALFSEFIEAEVGIKMPPVKKTMLQARLQKRLWKVGISTFDDYYQYVFSPEGRELELPNMIDVVTTNKTDFFREPKHFEILTQRILPELLAREGAERQIMIWCAGCSTGEEPYSLAMVLHDYAQQVRRFDFLILATDISNKVLEKARLGIYEEEMSIPIPALFRKRYLLKSKDDNKKIVRVVPEIRSLVKFRKLNLIRPDFGFRENMDIIFCRNVIIYFNRSIQEQVIGRICSYLNPGGYLFTGHSETLNGMKLPVKTVAHTVYQREMDVPLAEQLPIITLKPAEMFVSERPTIVRTVLGSCVAVTMFDSQHGVAAICHALLPESDTLSTHEEEKPNSYKYVDSVIPLMLKKLRNYGANPQDLEVKLFGGADMLGARTGKIGFQSVGKLNIEAVIQAIQSHGLRLKTSDVGGVFGRKILFYTHTGEVLLKRITLRTAYNSPAIE